MDKDCFVTGVNHNVTHVKCAIVDVNHQCLPESNYVSISYNGSLIGTNRYVIISYYIAGWNSIMSQCSVL